MPYLPTPATARVACTGSKGDLFAWDEAVETVEQFNHAVKAARRAYPKGGRVEVVPSLPGFGVVTWGEPPAIQEA